MKGGHAMEQEWLTVAEVAERLKVTEVTVRRWIRSGQMRALYLGSTKAGYRITRADLEAFLNERYEARGKDKAAA